MKPTRRNLARLLAVLACAAFLLLSFEVALVPTPSMEGTVLVGDNVLVFKLLDAPHIPGTSIELPRLHSPRRGSLVSFLSPAGSGTVFLKRVVAVAGDTVEMRDGLLYVNGVRNERYAGRSSRLPFVAPRLLRAKEIFVLGDNRDLSEDSRDFGPVPTDSVVGTPVAIFWSSHARTSDLLDGSGNIRLSFYWAAVLHPFASTRWGRVGRLL